MKRERSSKSEIDSTRIDPVSNSALERLIYHFTERYQAPGYTERSFIQSQCIYPEYPASGGNISQPEDFCCETSPATGMAPPGQRYSLPDNTSLRAFLALLSIVFLLC